VQIRGVECALQPFQLCGLLRACNCHHVKAQGLFCPGGVGLQVMLSCAQYACALARTDADKGTDEIIPASITHFHDDQFSAMGHDQVQFTEITPVVACQQSQAAALQVFQGEIFRGLAGRQVRCALIRPP